jgi:cytochrome c oxidase subunit 3/cytochrome o ubiquinol oxidase subunit 3
LAAEATPSHAEHGHATSLGLPHIKVGFWTFLGSECLFFGSLIATYMAYRNQSLVGPFPHAEWVAPDGAVTPGILSIPITSISAFVLLMSSVAMVISLDGFLKNSRLQARLWLFMTALLGLLFLGFQAFEFTEFYLKGLSLHSNLFGSTFFVLTGFHGTHVAIGVLWLLTLLVNDLRSPIRPADALKVEICGLYWHFVDIVWIVIFTFVYLVPTFERAVSNG